MKYISVFLFSVLCSLNAYSQCDSEFYMEKSLAKLTGGFTFLKSFKLEVPHGHFIPHTIVCSKGTIYSLKMTDADHHDGQVSIIAKLYDANEHEVASSVDEKTHTLQDGFTFICPETGIYRLDFIYVKSKKKCGGAVLGFKRHRS